MDLELYFLREVIDKYKVDKILKPLSLGNGELQNVSLSHLRKELDFCYYEISHSITFKEKLLDYLEDYLVDLRALRISEQKAIIKELRQEVINVEDKPVEDDNVIEELNTVTWKIDQEKYILHYLKEQKYFIRNWISEKRKEDKDTFLKNFINKVEKKELVKDLKNNKKNKVIKKYKWHALIEPLVSGKITEIQNSSYQDLSKNDLSKKIIYDLNLDLNAKDIAPYIYYSFIQNKEHNKNLYSEKKVSAIYKYCKENNIEIKDYVFSLKVKQYINP